MIAIRYSVNGALKLTLQSGDHIAIISGIHYYCTSVIHKMFLAISPIRLHLFSLIMNRIKYIPLSPILKYFQTSINVGSYVKK